MRWPSPTALPQHPRHPGYPELPNGQLLRSIGSLISATGLATVVRVPVVLLLHFSVALRGPDQQANPDGRTDQADDGSEDIDDDHSNIMALVRSRR